MSDIVLEGGRIKRIGEGSGRFAANAGGGYFAVGMGGWTSGAGAPDYSERFDPDWVVQYPVLTPPRPCAGVTPVKDER